MPTITTITAKYARKFNLGNYQTADLEITLIGDRDEGEDPAAAIQKLQDLAREAVRAEYRRLAAAQAAAPQQPPVQQNQP
jgi:hypothetical protein